MRRSIGRLRRHGIGIDLDCDQTTETGPRASYLALSAVTGGKFTGAVANLLRDAARKEGFRSQFWLTRGGLKNHFDGEIYPAYQDCGVDIGIGFGPLRVYNVADVESTDLHIFLGEHPLPDDDALFAGHLIYLDCRWMRFKSSVLSSSLDQLHMAYFHSPQRLLRADDKTMVALSSAFVRHPDSCMNRDAYAPEDVFKSPPRRWISRQAVSEMRLNLHRGSECYDVIGRQKSQILYNAEQTNRLAEIESAWAHRIPTELSFIPHIAVAAEQYASTAIPQASAFIERLVEARGIRSARSRDAQRGGWFKAGSTPPSTPTFATHPVPLEGRTGLLPQEAAATIASGDAAVEAALQRYLQRMVLEDVDRVD